MGRWDSRDPVNEAGGLSVYGFADNSPTDNIDILGQITSKNQERRSTHCGGFSAAFTFELDAPAPSDGYLVQEITFEMDARTCAGLPVKFKAHYRERVGEKIEQGKKIAFASGDFWNYPELDCGWGAFAAPLTRGKIRMAGRVRFYSAAEVDFQGWSPETYGGLSGFCSAPGISTRNFLSTQSMPLFWGKGAIESTINVLTMSWDCCCSVVPARLDIL